MKYRRRKPWQEPNWNRPHAVYRLWDATGVLLYVGCSIKPEGRYYRHRRETTWYADVTAAQLTWYPTRGTALLAEWVAIDQERPLWNEHDGLRTRATVRSNRRIPADAA